MPLLLIMRGLPASGKSTIAKQWVAESRVNRVRINRDDLRTMIDDGEWISGLTEPRIAKARDLLILGFLRQGKDVVVDDTNLPARVVRDLMDLARRTGATVEIQDLTEVPLETCIERDAKRYLDNASSRSYVGENVIRQFHQQFLAGKKGPLPVPEFVPAASAVVEPYVAQEGLSKAVLVDLDGTMALMDGRRPFEWHRVGEDLPNKAVIETVRALHAAGYLIVFLSGRDGVCQAETQVWLDQHAGFNDWELYMRPQDDNRKDSVVKLELFNGYVRNRYNVHLVLDDRDQVVELWRALGIPCFQVAPGNF